MIPLLQCGVALAIAASQPNTKHHWAWWWSIWKCHPLLRHRSQHHQLLVESLWAHWFLNFKNHQMCLVHHIYNVIPNVHAAEHSSQINCLTADFIKNSDLKCYFPLHIQIWKPILSQSRLQSHNVSGRETTLTKSESGLQKKIFSLIICHFITLLIIFLKLLYLTAGVFKIQNTLSPTLMPKQHVTSR